MSDVAPRISKRRARVVSAHTPHIGIIGAGLSGLRCADVLLQHGFRVTIVEGRDRLGGRVHQVTLPSGRLIDAGPNWIHGTDNNPILDIARETGTQAGSWVNRSSIVDETGRLLPRGDAAFYSETMWDIIGAAFAHSNAHCATIDPGESLWDFFRREVPKRITEDQPDWEAKRRIVYQLAEDWGAYVGGPITDQSLKFFWLEECIDGENLFCADTYQKILQAIARPAVEGAQFRYQTVVNRIETTSDDDDDDADDGTVRVFTDAGETLAFDDVVLTAPLGWLKRNPHAFDPPLPARLSQAIANIGYGCLEKFPCQVFISFPRAFWHPASPTSGADDGDGRLIQGAIQMLAPAYAPESNPQRWGQEVVELASLGPSSSSSSSPKSDALSQPTLLFYTYGDQSRYLTSEVAKLPTPEARDAFLCDWFRPYYSRLPNFDASSPDCQPDGVFATSWLRDDLAGRGGYSRFPVGLEAGDADVECLRRGEPPRGLWLAGEHTAPFVALGTATGAYWSGGSVAGRVAAAYGMGSGGGGSGGEKSNDSGGGGPGGEVPAAH
ncbi:FAD/NAD(P)-binding domain-containing protein [Xylariaceae sp. FL0804]|nr:FAD/NAD(P)-binding domain-containing protein [Xylariaceae sp. FL0804]